jgi:hypothetical protein
MGTASRGSSGTRNTGSQTSGGLLSVAPGILGGLVADLCGRGVEPAVVGRLAGPAGRIGVRRLPSPR